MPKTILLLVLTSIVGIFAAGCTSTLPSIAFQPRVYPYVPQLGPDGPSSSGEAK